MKRFPKKDFQKKKFKNPFFQKKGSAARSTWAKLYILIMSLLFIGGVYFFGYSNVFSITRVQVEGNQRVGEETVHSIVNNQLAHRRFLLFSQKNILFFKADAVAQQLEDIFLIDSVNIKRTGLHSITVTIFEKTSGVVWAIGNDQWYLDQDGIAIDKLDPNDLVIQSVTDGTDIIRPELTSGNYPLIYDQSGSDVQIGSSATSDQLVHFMIGLSEALQQQTTIDVSHFTVERPYLPEVAMITKDGFAVYFRVDDQPALQVQTLQALLQQKIHDQRNLQYIDLRFGERVFYK